MRSALPLTVVVALLLVTASVPAGGGGPKAFFSGPGTLGAGPQGCLAFFADAGGLYFLGDYGGFGPDDRVFVSGVIDPESFLCFPSPLPWS